MQDAYKREINYLRVSVTDRCNLRCIYCMPPGGVKLVSYNQILRNEEIARLVDAATLTGIRKIRLTGGEPLVRRGLVKLVSAIRAVPEIDDIALTTNGVLLPAMGRELKEAGLCRVNISLDTLDPALFRSITRYGELDKAWKGIETALDLGLNPVKINTVVMRGINDSEILRIAALTLKYPLHVRFIELMPVGTSDAWAPGRYVPTAEVKAAIEAGLGEMKEVRKLAGNGPAMYYRLSGAPGTIGFISAVSDHFCQRCNRLRLTAEGMIRPCLHSGREIDARTPLRRGAGKTELADLFRQAVLKKPDRHNMDGGWRDEKRIMSQIGG
ncbi:MAG: GTP 3',8-cyclase MoaA [Peptococcaceae bacterium]|nr:GTP 3',8-cyclase MoaA [Peptococcaceae bacterium]